MSEAVSNDLQPMHVIRLRDPTEDEWDLIRDRVRADLGGLFWAFLAGVAAVLLSWWIHDFMAPFLGPFIVLLSNLAIAAVGVSTVTWVLKIHFRHEKKRLQGAVRDLEMGQVQEIYVHEPRIFRLSPLKVDDLVPCHLCLDLGEGLLLYLGGEWIFDPLIFGATIDDLEKLQETDFDRVNFMPDPFGFPCTEFILTRLPGSGTVLSVKILGKYLGPLDELDVMEREHDFQDSELLQGKLEDIAMILAREHERRAPTPHSPSAEL